MLFRFPSRGLLGVTSSMLYVAVRYPENIRRSWGRPYELPLPVQCIAPFWIVTSCLIKLVKSRAFIHIWRARVSHGEMIR